MKSQSKQKTDGYGGCLLMIIIMIITAIALSSCTSTKSGCWKGAEPKLRPFNKIRA